MQRTNRRMRLGRLMTTVFAVGFVASIFFTISAFAAANLFKIQNAELSELSATAEGAIASFDEENIVSDVTFHKLDDFAKYAITLKNTDSVGHVIESITDDNENPYVSYEYSQHAGEQIDAGADLVFVVTAKYTTAVTDMSQRAQATNVRFFIHFTDIDEEIPVVPNTGASAKASSQIYFSVASLVISAAGLTVIGIIALKKHKKASKYIIVGIIAVAAVATTATVKAATVAINSFTLTTNYTLKDRLVVTWTDANGDEHETLVPYNEPANIPDPNKDGHTFTGWIDENNNPVDLTQPITEDIKIRPTFRVHQYTIRFNGNGATSGEMTDLAMTFGEAKTLPANAFAWAGHEYTGWDTEANGSGAHYGDAAEVTDLTTEDNVVVVLYAQWSVNPFHIDYDGNGATSGEMATTNCDYDQSCILRDNAFSKPGYHFTGWKYNNNDYANKADVTNIIESGTITMVAQWAANHYTIIFDINTEDPNAAGNMADMTNLEYDHDYTLTANAFTRTGYNFGGWNTEIDGRNFGLTDEQEFHNLTTTDNAVITLYAQWNPIHYTIAFHQNSDGVTGNMSSQVFAYDEAKNLTQNAFIKNHYKFMGWTTAANGTGTKYDDRASIFNLTTEDGATIDLYAQWKERTAYLKGTVNNSWGSAGDMIRSLQGYSAATSFSHYEGEPNFDEIETKYNMAISSSNFPVYTWIDGETIYWWSEAETIYAHEDSRNFFSGLKKAETIDYSGFNFSLTKNLTGFFRNTEALSTIDLSPLAAANPTTLEEMFYGSGIASVDLSPLDTTQTINMKGMFDSTTALETVNLSAIDTTNVTDMSYLFNNSTNLKSVDFSHNNLSSVENMSNMFRADKKLESLNFTGVNTPNLKKMSWMFGGAKIASLDLSDLDTGNVTHFDELFYYADVANLDISGFDTHNATTFGSMFTGFNAHGQVLDLSHFDTTSLNGSMYEMFNGTNASVIDLSSFDISAERAANIGMANILHVSNSVETIYATEKLHFHDYSSVPDTNLGVPADYGGQSKLVGGAGSTLAKLTLLGIATNDKARIDDPCNGKPGMFAVKNAQYICYNANIPSGETGAGAQAGEYLTVGTNHLKDDVFTRQGYTFLGWATSANGDVVYASGDEITIAEESKTPLELYAKWEAKTSYLQTGSTVRNIIFSSTTSAKTFTHYEGIPDLDSIAGKKVISTTASATPTYAWVDGETIYWWADAAKVYMAADSSSMFEGRANLTTINLAGLDSSAVTNASKMFKGCTGLAELDLSPLSDAQLADVTYMFDGASNLAAADLSKLNTSQVTDFTGFLRNNSSRTSIDLSTIDTSSATNLTSMLEGCSGITSLDLSKLNSQNVTNMTALFKGMSGLTELNLAPLYAEKVDTMTSLFENCTGIASLDVSVLDTKNVEKMDSMFSGMSELVTLKVYDNDNDTTAFQTSKVTTMAKMFNNDQKLTDLDVTHFDVSKVEDMSSMFLRNYNANIDITNWDTSNLKNMSQMFFVYGNGNPNLPTGYKTMNTSSVTNMDDFFRTMPGQGYSDIDFSQWDFSKVTTPNFAGNNYGVYSGRTMHLGVFDLSSMANNGKINFGNVKVTYVSANYNPSIAAGKNLTFNYPNGTVGQNGTRFTFEPGTQTVVSAEYMRIDDPAHGNPGSFWVENPLVVNFDAGEGVASYASYRYIPGTDYGALPTITTSPEGKAFAGWYTAAEGGEKVEDNGAFISSDTHALYAHWSTVDAHFKPRYNSFSNLGTPTAGVTNFAKAPTTPTEEFLNTSAVVISDEASPTPIYGWIDGANFYWWSEDATPALNENSNYFFNLFRDLKTIDFTGLDFSQVKKMTGMFKQTQIESIDLSWLDASNVTLMDSLFEDCGKLTTANLGGSFANMNNVTDLSYMFSGAGLEVIDIESWGWHTDSLQSMNSMFGQSLTPSTIKRVILGENFDSSHVTDMNNLFEDASKLEYVDLEHLDTSSATQMQKMFFGVSLSELHLENFDTRNVKTFGGMFSYAPNLTTIYVGENFVVGSDVHDTHIFKDSTKLVGGAGTTYDATPYDGNGDDMKYLRIDDPAHDNPGYLTSAN